MAIKRTPGSKSRLEPEQPPTLGEMFSELSESSKVKAPSVSARAPRARRAGPFKVPASIAGPGNSDRELLARRFKQHLRGVSGSNKLGPDPDETVPVSRAQPQRAARPGFGFRPGMPSRFGRSSPTVVDDDEDE